MKTSNINIRVDKKTKEKCEKIYESLGINMSIAINLFLNQSIRVNGIPFEIIAPETDDINSGDNGTVTICNKKVSCIKKDGMHFFEYNNKKFVIAYEKIDANELCIYPNAWRVENKGVLPSLIHFETSDITEYQSKYFRKMLDINEDINKIIVIRKVNKISIHPNYEKKQLLLPENKVNGVNIVMESEVNNLLTHYDDFCEQRDYII